MPDLMLEMLALMVQEGRLRPSRRSLGPVVAALNGNFIIGSAPSSVEV